MVRRQGGEGTHKDLLVRRQRVVTALNWLRANNPSTAISASTRTTSIRCRITVPCKTYMRRARMMTSILNEILNLNRTVHLGGTKTPSLFFDRSSETVCRRTPLSICSYGNASGSAPQHCCRRWLPLPDSSFCRPLARNGGHAPQRVQVTGAIYLVFPCFFPYGRRDPIYVARRQKVTNADGFKHLLRYYDVDESGERFWFATYPRFPHWAQNMLERHRLLSQASVFKTSQRRRSTRR